MEGNTDHIPAKRKRGRPSTHVSSKAKKEADVIRRRATCQHASSYQRERVHTNFYNSPYSSLFEGGDCYPPANHSDTPDPVQGDISPFLPASDHLWDGDAEDQAVSGTDTPAYATDTSPASNHECPDPDEGIPSDAAWDSSPQPGNEESDETRDLAQTLAE